MNSERGLITVTEDPSVAIRYRSCRIERFILKRTSESTVDTGPPANQPTSNDLQRPKETWVLIPRETRTLMLTSLLKMLKQGHNFKRLYSICKKSQTIQRNKDLSIFSCRKRKTSRIRAPAPRDSLSRKKT